jgi:hypothetical protein
MSNRIDRTTVRLMLNKDVTEQCYPPFPELFTLLLKYISGQAEGSFGDLIISGQEPSPDDTGKLWLRVSPDGKNFEFNVFVNGKWVPWNFVAANEIRFFGGTLPDGWTKIGEFKTEDVPVTAAPAGGGVPAVIIMAKWVGY